MAFAACGDETKTVTETSSEKVSEALGKESNVDFASCPQARTSHELAEETIAEGQKALAEGAGVKAAEANVRIGKKMLRQSLRSCATEADLKSQETKICDNTPAELAEALEIENTPANREYIEVYEATCRKPVPTKQASETRSLNAP
jgi:hypothetical protein